MALKCDKLIRELWSLRRVLFRIQRLPYDFFIEIVGLAPAATAMVSKHLTSSLSDASVEGGKTKERSKPETPKNTVLGTPV